MKDKTFIMAHHSEVRGLVDQLEDRLLCKQEVASSNLAQSTLIISRVGVATLGHMNIFCNKPALNILICLSLFSCADIFLSIDENNFDIIICSGIVGI